MVEKGDFFGSARPRGLSPTLLVIRRSGRAEVCSRVGQLLVLPYVMAGPSSANELGVWSRSIESGELSSSHRFGRTDYSPVFRLSTVLTD